MTPERAIPSRVIDILALYDALPELDFSRCPWCAELVDECVCARGVDAAIWTAYRPGQSEDTP